MALAQASAQQPRPKSKTEAAWLETLQMTRRCCSSCANCAVKSSACVCVWVCAKARDGSNSSNATHTHRLTGRHSNSHPHMHTHWQREYLLHTLRGRSSNIQRSQQPPQPEFPQQQQQITVMLSIFPTKSIFSSMFRGPSILSLAVALSLSFF